MQDVHEEAQRRETEELYSDRRDDAEMSLFRSRSVTGSSPVVYTKEERWSHDKSQSDVLCNATRLGFAGHLSEKVHSLRLEVNEDLQIDVLCGALLLGVAEHLGEKV